MAHDDDGAEEEAVFFYYFFIFFLSVPAPGFSAKVNTGPKLSQPSAAADR